MVTIKLTEFDKAEWFEVMKRLRPNLSTAAEVDELWARFQRDKSEHQRKMKLQ